MAHMTRKVGWHRAMKKLEWKARSLFFTFHTEGLLKGFQQILNLHDQIWTLEHLTFKWRFNALEGKIGGRGDQGKHQGHWLLF